MRNLVIELFNRDLINLVEDVDGRDVNAVSFNDVNKIVCSGVASERDVDVVHSILREDSLGLNHARNSRQRCELVDTIRLKKEYLTNGIPYQ